MTITVLGSGSSGNGYILRNQEEALIIECGMPVKDALEILQHDTNLVRGCLVTHSHGDHFGYIRQYARYFRVFATKGTYEDKGMKPDNFHLLSIAVEEPFKLGGFTIIPFITEHDTSEPCGYIIKHPDMGIMLFATDTHHLRYKFEFPIDYILIECNHTDELVAKSIGNGIIPRKVGLRAKATHMSLERCIRCLRSCNTSKTKEIILIHISENNGNRELFRNEVAKAIGKPTICASKGDVLECF